MSLSPSPQPRWMQLASIVPSSALPTCFAHRLSFLRSPSGEALCEALCKSFEKAGELEQSTCKAPSLYLQTHKQAVLSEVAAGCFSVGSLLPSSSAASSFLCQPRLMLLLSIRPPLSPHAHLLRWSLSRSLVRNLGGSRGERTTYWKTPSLYLQTHKQALPTSKALC